MTGTGGKVSGHLVDRWWMAMKGPGVCGNVAGRRDREAECDQSIPF